MVGAALAVVASLALAGSALAAGFTNGGFAGTSVASGGTYQDGGSGFMPSVSGTTIPGWTISGAVDWIGTYWQSEDGDGYSIDMNASPTAGTLTQTFDTVVNATYAVQFWLSGNPMCGAGDKTLTVSSGATSQDFTFTVPTSWAYNKGAMTWASEMFSFVATSTSATLSFASTTTGNCGPALDNVSMTAVAATGAQCKDGGWKTMYDENGALFKNQGDCVSFYATSGAVPIGS